MAWLVFRKKLYSVHPTVRPHKNWTFFMIDTSTLQSHPNINPKNTALTPRFDSMGVVNVDALPTLNEKQIIELSQEAENVVNLAGGSDAETAMQALARLEEIVQFPSITLTESSARILMSIGVNAAAPIELRDKSLTLLARYFLSLVVIPPDEMEPLFAMIGPGMLHGAYIAVFDYINIPQISQSLLKSNFLAVIN